MKVRVRHVLGALILLGIALFAWFVVDYASLPEVPVRPDIRASGDTLTVPEQTRAASKTASENNTSAGLLQSDEGATDGESGLRLAFVLRSPSDSHVDLRSSKPDPDAIAASQAAQHALERFLTRMHDEELDLFQERTWAAITPKRNHKGDAAAELRESDYKAWLKATAALRTVWEALGERGAQSASHVERFGDAQVKLYQFAQIMAARCYVLASLGKWDTWRAEVVPAINGIIAVMEDDYDTFYFSLCYAFDSITNSIALALEANQTTPATESAVLSAQPAIGERVAIKLQRYAERLDDYIDQLQAHKGGNGSRKALAAIHAWFWGNEKQREPDSSVVTSALEAGAMLFAVNMQHRTTLQQARFHSAANRAWATAMRSADAKAARDWRDRSALFYGLLHDASAPLVLVDNEQWVGVFVGAMRQWVAIDRTEFRFRCLQQSVRVKQVLKAYSERSAALSAIAPVLANPDFAALEAQPEGDALRLIAEMPTVKIGDELVPAQLFEVAFPLPAAAAHAGEGE